MGIFGAMNTAITGLGAQSTALEHISNNIANSQTTGYKRTETSFAEMVQDSDPKDQALGVVGASSRATNDVQGQPQTSDVTTHLAVNGDGYFIVAEREGTVDGKPVFSADNRFTRRGDFDLDANGYLVNSSGYYLKGVEINPDTGNEVGSIPELIQISDGFLPAKATSEINYYLNLPNYPATATADNNIPNSELLNAAGFATDPTVAGTGTVTGAETQNFIDRSISGGAVTAYNSKGTPVNIEFRWAKTDSIANGGADTWEMFYLADPDAGAADTAWVNAGQSYAFGNDGKLNPPIGSITLSDVTIKNAALGDIKLDHSEGDVTQYASADGSTRTTVSQNGYTASEFVSIGMSDDGRVMAKYSNGRELPIASVTLASFSSDSNLAKVDGGAFRETPASGAPNYAASGSISSKMLELSNTDIADEFSKLIVTQQAYAANTRIVSTGDEMMQETLNMVR